MRKAVSSDITAAFLLFIALILTVLIISYMVNSGITQSQSIENQYTATRADIAMQGLIEGFEKTATFFGLMSAAKELGAHGGVSNAATLAAGTFNPKMDAPGGVASWSVSRCDNALGNPTSTIRKRVPFLLYRDRNARIGTANEQVSLNAIFKYQQNLDDVLAGGYRFYALAQIFMLRPGTVEVTVCTDVTCLPAVTVSQSGTVIIPFGNDILTSTTGIILLNVVGSADDVAVLRQVAVSIYNNDMVKDPDNVLARYVNAYRASHPSSVQNLNFKLSNYDAAFIPAGNGIFGNLDVLEGFTRGILWAPDKITTGGSSVNVSGFGGFAEDEALLRYFRIQRFAEFFATNYSAWVKPMWWNRLNTLPDHYLDWRIICSSDPSDPNLPPTYSAMSCPGDGLHLTSADFLNAINQDLANIATDLNAQFGSIGISWTIAVPASLFDGCDVNPHAADATIQSCNRQNMEYYEYKTGWRENLGKGYCGCQVDDRNRCTMHYDHRYILKNVPIYVTITDNKYKIFDSASKAWIPYSFTFDVDIDRVDDNACDKLNEVCSTQTTAPTTPMPVPPVVAPPDIINPPPPETCPSIPGQTCELGADCSLVGKISGAGTCNAGKTCCTNAGVPPPETCTTVLGQTCEIGAGCPVSKIPAAGTCNAGKTCCKDIPLPVDCAYTPQNATSAGYVTVSGVKHYNFCTDGTHLALQYCTGAFTWAQQAIPCDPCDMITNVCKLACKKYAGVMSCPGGILSGASCADATHVDNPPTFVWCYPYVSPICSRYAGVAACPGAPTSGVSCSDLTHIDNPPVFVWCYPYNSAF